MTGCISALIFFMKPSRKYTQLYLTLLIHLFPLNLQKHAFRGTNMISLRLDNMTLKTYSIFSYTDGAFLHLATQKGSTR